MEATVGRLVKSAAGRDKDTFLVIMRADGEFVYLANGKDRPLSRLKKKRIKHVKFTNTVIDTDQLTDKKLRGIISGFNDKSKNLNTDQGGSQLV